MRKKLTLLLVAIMALPSLCAASDAIKDDSVKVIKNPEQVTDCSDSMSTATTKTRTTAMNTLSRNAMTASSMCKRAREAA